LEKDRDYVPEYICEAVAEVYELLSEEDVSKLKQRCIKTLKKDIEKIKTTIGELRKKLNTLIEPVERRCDKCPIGSRSKLIKKLFEKYRKLVEEFRKTENEVKEIRRKIYEKCEKISEEYWNKIMSELSKIKEVQVIHKDRYGAWFIIEVKIGNGRYIPRDRFNQIINKLKQLGFRFDSKTKTWKINVRIDNDGWEIMYEINDRVVKREKVSIEE